MAAIPRWCSHRRSGRRGLRRAASPSRLRVRRLLTVWNEKKLENKKIKKRINIIANNNGECVILKKKKNSALSTRRRLYANTVHGMCIKVIFRKASERGSRRVRNGIRYRERRVFFFPMLSVWPLDHVFILFRPRGGYMRRRIMYIMAYNNNNDISIVMLYVYNMIILSYHERGRFDWKKNIGTLGSPAD